MTPLALCITGTERTAYIESFSSVEEMIAFRSKMGMHSARKLVGMKVKFTYMEVPCGTQESLKVDGSSE